MDGAARALCENIEGAQFAFVQSDEISVLLTDFASPQTEAWFDGSVQKMVSISASLATAHFNRARGQRAGGAEKLACFDSRVFTIPDPVEVENYFIWRQGDATRNSISMTAQAHFSHARLQGMGTDQMQEMLWQEKNLNWNDLPGGFKRGRCLVRTPTVQDVEYQDKRTGEMRRATGVERHIWECIVPPVWTQDRAWLGAHIPRHAP